MERLSERQMQRLTASLRTKADKIRALGRAGVGAGDIGRFLGIRYQHAYNVLKRSGIAPGGNAIRDSDLSSGSSAPHKAALDQAGRIRVPERVLEAWSASPGEELLVQLEGDELRVLTRRAGLQRAREIFRTGSKPGHGRMADELIGERRREAGRDEEPGASNDSSND